MTPTHRSSLQRIVRDPNILLGKPVVRGTRIPVALVLAKLAANPDLADLFTDFPRLTEEDVKACLAYAAMAVEREEHAARPDPVPATLGA